MQTRIVALAVLVMAAVSPVHAGCIGDCSGDGVVNVAELITEVNIALGSLPLTACPAGDLNHDKIIAIDEVLLGVQRALVGCDPTSLIDLEIPDTFDYATTQEIAVALTVCTPNGRPYPGVLVMIGAPPNASAATPDVIWRGATDRSGQYQSQVEVPATFTAVRVVVSAPGVVNDVLVPITEGRVVHDFHCGATGQVGSAPR